MDGLLTTDCTPYERKREEARKLSRVDGARKLYHPNGPNLTIGHLGVREKFADILNLFRYDSNVKGYSNRDLLLSDASV